MKKKILAILLCVAMMLSIAPIAVLADPITGGGEGGSGFEPGPAIFGNNVAKVGDTEYATFSAAVEAATAGDTITLLDDVSVLTDRYPISKSLTIDGAGNTITVAARGFGVGNGATSNIDVTFKNVTIVNTTGTRCIDTRGHINSLTLDHVTLSTAGTSNTGYLQPLTIGGNQASTATININDSTIKTSEDGTKGYAIITFNPVDMTVTDSTIKGWACFYPKGPDGSAGSAGSTFTIDGCTLVSKNVYSGETNSFAMIQTEDDNITFDITDTNIAVDGANNSQAIFSLKNNIPVENVAVNLGEGNEVELLNEGTFGTNLGLGEDITLEITGGTFNVDPTDYLADGYVPETSVDPETGDTVYGVDGPYAAKIDGTYYATLADAVAAAEAGDTITIVSDFTTDAAKKAEADRLVITKDLTIDFGEYTMTVPGELEPTDNWAAFYIDGADVVFNATTGGLNCEDKLEEIPGGDHLLGVYGACVYGDGSLTINGGNYYCGETIAQAGRKNLGGATITVNDGNFSANSVLYRYVFNIYDTCRDSSLIEIKGGTFTDFNPADCLAEGEHTNFVADGYASFAEGNAYTVKKVVAEIDGTLYASFDEAVAAADDNDTIKLHDDVVLPGNYYAINDDIAIDLAGKAISGASLDVYGALTINDTVGDGTITGAKHGIWVNPDASLTVNGGTIAQSGVGIAIRVEAADLTINGGAVVNATGARAIYADGASTIAITGGAVTSDIDNTDAICIEDTTTAEISGGTVTGHDWGVTVFDNAVLTVSGTAAICTDANEGYAISTNGNDGQNATVNVTGGTVTGAELGIYAPSGTLNVSGGTITGATGIYFKSTNLDITGGTIIGTGADVDYNYNGNGANPTGDALVIDACGYPNGIDDVSISGGTFTSANAEAVAAYTYQENEPVEEFISGGTYSSAPAGALLEDGHATANQNGVYTIHEVTVSYEFNNVAGVYSAIFSYECQDAEIEDQIVAAEKVDLFKGVATYEAVDSYGNVATKTVEEEYTVTYAGVTYGPYKWGEKCTLDAGVTSTWSIDGNVVADGTSTYLFAVTANTAVTSEGSQVSEPQPILSTTMKTPAAGKAVFNAKWSIPAGATINSVKVYRGTTKNYKTSITAAKIIAGNAVTDAKLYALNGDYTLNITGLDAARCLYAVIVIDYTPAGASESTQLISEVAHIFPNGAAEQ